MALDLLNIVNKTLSLGTIASQVFIVLAIIYILVRLTFPSLLLGISVRFTPLNFFGKNGILLAFLVSLAATSGSLFYSEYAGFTPCLLCWYQRIFMYPEVILLGMALYKKDKKIIDYALALAAAGILVSAYHNYIFYNRVVSLVCTISEPCTVNFVLEYGYITIPVMALTAFALIILFLGFQKKWTN